MKEIGNARKKILVVDDNKTIVSSITGVLKKEGYITGSAFDGKTALKKVFSVKYDLILLDITLPDMDGFTVCAEIKENPHTKNIPVIFISAQDDDSIYMKGFELGAMDYLRKPVTSAELLFRVKNYLRLGLTEAKLRQSEIYFKRIVDDQTEFVVRYIPDGTISFVNTTFCRYLEKPINEIIGKNFFDVLNLDKDAEIRSRIIMPRMHVQTDVVKITRSDGAVAWHQWIQRAIPETTTQKAVVQAIGRDITESKEREDALRKWETIFKNAGWGIVTSLPDTPYLGQMNEAYARMHGYTVEELTGKSIRSVYSHRSDKFVEEIFRNVKKTGHFTFQAVHKRKNGEEFTAFTDVSNVMDDKGNELLVVANVQDISEIVRTTNALKESEEKFRNVFMNTPDVIVILRQKDLRLIAVNDKFVNNSGYTREEVLYKSRFVNNLFQDQNELLSLLKLLRQNKVVTNFEAKLKTKQGHVYPALISLSKVKLNRATHIVTIVRNIEEIKKFQVSLQKSETKFRLLADYNYNWEFWLGPDNKYIYVSPSCERITGYKSEDFLKRPSLMLKLIHPDYIKKISNHLKNEHKDRDKATSLEFIIIDRNGNEKWISHNCNPVFDEAGVFLGRRGNNLDISNKKLADKELLKLSTAVEQSSSAIIITDTEGLIQYVNPYFVKLTGYSFQEVIGKNPKILKSGKTDPKTYKELWDSITSGKIWQGEFINRKKNDELFIEHAIISPVKDEKGKIVNFVAIKQDITKQKEVDRKILQTIISTEEKERRRFAQDLHDDLGPLLSTAKLYIRSFETATDLKNKEIAISRSMQAIDEAIMSIKEIANNISPHILRNFGLNSAINSTVNKINETKSVSISFTTRMVERFDENMELSLFRIVAELVNNTIKHAHATKAYIDLNKTEKDLILTYSDDGIGFQIESALEKKMCRGLSNILNRVKSLGGEIELDSDTGKGLNVFINIPVESHLVQ
jgi:PAS domain S-box-containing protein